MSISVVVTPSGANVTVVASPGGLGGPASYLHTQGVPAAVWTIPHNLGFYPGVTVIDSAGAQVIGDVSYPTINTAVVTFSAAMSGRAALS